MSRCGLDCPFCSLSCQVLELGEDLLDRVEGSAVDGAAGRRAWRPRREWARRVACPLGLPRLSVTTMSPGEIVGTRNCSTQVQSLRLMGSSMMQSGSMRSRRSTARKVSVRRGSSPPGTSSVAPGACSHRPVLLAGEQRFLKLNSFSTRHTDIGLPGCGARQAPTRL